MPKNKTLKIYTYFFIYLSYLIKTVWLQNLNTFSPSLLQLLKDTQAQHLNQNGATLVISQSWTWE